MNETFVRLAQEPFSGDAFLIVEQAVTGWSIGDRLVIPDTRHLKTSEAGAQDPRAGTYF